MTSIIKPPELILPPNLGIDLGTSYSRIASCDCFKSYGSTYLEMIHNTSDGDVTTPSVVYFNKSEIAVGHKAKALCSLYPDNVISFIKREIGKKWEKEIDGIKLTPETVLNQIFKTLLDKHGRFREYFITCPVCFNSFERKTIIEAAKLAGLKDVHLIDEPVAAARYFMYLNNIGLEHLDNDDIERIKLETIVDDDCNIPPCNRHGMLVYNLGGGFFDAAVILIEDDKIKVVCADGAKLGGKDWDERIVKVLINKIAVSNGLYQEDVEKDSSIINELRQQAETVKKELSNRLSTYVHITFKGKTEIITVTRAEFEDNTADLLERTIKITKDMIDLAKKKRNVEISDFLLAGGSSQMPQVITEVKAKFRATVERFHILDDQAIVKGAALGVKEYEMVASTSYSIFDGNSLVPDIIRKQAVLPAIHHISIPLADLSKNNNLQIFSGRYPTYEHVGDFNCEISFKGPENAMVDIDLICTEENTLSLTAKLNLELQTEFVDDKEHKKIKVSIPTIENLARKNKITTY